ncbi:MAG: class I SAM-dependent methyltransferase [Methanomicrobiaceae archaeon]|uniref:Methyltransferase type 11 n=1 Tax=hydrocarbon metagenome TaxID=938273 RepID=A0A0W8FHW3_9ZZZZ|nr:class I SAM-dependent methyltransferase [Methanomicrobiaceae archaeon]MDD5420142.1 class I SAM-dependent methyltransferase [Methanomicrobiaceae archaeon]
MSASRRYSSGPGGHRDVCPATHARFLDHPLRRLFHPPKRILDRYICRGDAVLDIGPGSGFFTRPMARMVGDEGYVVAADLQDEMLAMLKQRAESEGLLSRIRIHRTSADTLGLTGYGPFDFILAFYVIHELPDAGRCFCEIAPLLRPGGRMLIAEPKSRISAGDFERVVATAAAAGLVPVEMPAVFLSRAALMEKA